MTKKTTALNNAAQKRKNKNAEPGRSMIEILGVLVIIGVLSIGGVYGYGIAMKKNKVNQFMNALNMDIIALMASRETNDDFYIFTGSPTASAMTPEILAGIFDDSSANEIHYELARWQDTCEVLDAGAYVTKKTCDGFTKQFDVSDWETVYGLKGCSSLCFNDGNRYYAYINCGNYACEN